MKKGGANNERTFQTELVVTDVFINTFDNGIHVFYQETCHNLQRASS